MPTELGGSGTPEDRRLAGELHPEDAELSDPIMSGIAECQEHILELLRESGFEGKPILLGGQEIGELLEPDRHARAIRLLESWMADPSGYDLAVWPRVQRAVDANRLSDRQRLGE